MKPDRLGPGASAGFRIAEPGQACGGTAVFTGVFMDPKRKPDAKAGNPDIEIVLTLPDALTDEHRKWLVTDFVRNQITRGTDRVAYVTIHGGEVHDAHIVVCQSALPIDRLQARWAALVDHYRSRFAKV